MATFHRLDRRLVLNIYLTIVGILFVAIAAWFLYGDTFGRQESFIGVATTTQTVISTASHPIQLVIPAAGVDAEVEEVGVTSSGAMATAKKIKNVGWYKYGVVPGQMGSAVIDGHVDDWVGLAGVFRNLKDLKVGDGVYVDAENGERLHFVVTDIRIYPYKSVPVEKIFISNDVPRLNLITCTGAWIRSEKTYDHRLVVYTELRNK